MMNQGRVKVPTNRRVLVLLSIRSLGRGKTESFSSLRYNYMEEKKERKEDKLI